MRADHTRIVKLDRTRCSKREQPANKHYPRSRQARGRAKQGRLSLAAIYVSLDDSEVVVRHLDHFAPHHERH